MWQFELSSNKCWRICPALQPCHQSTKSIVSCSSFGCQRWQGGDRKKATAVASQKKSPTQGRKRHDWNQTQWQLETLPPFCWVLSHKTALQSSHQHQLWSGFESCEQSWLMLTLGFLQIKERYNSMQLTYIIKWKPIIIFPTTHGRVMNRLRRFSPLPERKSYGWRSWGCRRWCLFLLLIIMIVNYNNNYYQIEIALYISYTSSAVYLLKKLTLANTIFTSTHHPSTPSTRHPHCVGGFTLRLVRHQPLGISSQKKWPFSTLPLSSKRSWNCKMSKFPETVATRFFLAFWVRIRL